MIQKKEGTSRTLILTKLNFNTDEKQGEYHPGCLRQEKEKYFQDLTRDKIQGIVPGSPSQVS